MEDISGVSAGELGVGGQQQWDVLAPRVAGLDQGEHRHRFCDIPAQGAWSVPRCEETSDKSKARSDLQK